MTSIVEPMVRWILRRYPLPKARAGRECEFFKTTRQVCGIPVFDVCSTRGDHICIGQVEWSNQGHLWVFNAHSHSRMNLSRQILAEIHKMMQELGANVERRA